MNTMLVYTLRDDSYSIETTNHPLPATARREVSRGNTYHVRVFKWPINVLATPLFPSGDKKLYIMTQTENICAPYTRTMPFGYIIVEHSSHASFTVQRFSNFAMVFEANLFLFQLKFRWFLLTSIR